MNQRNSGWNKDDGDVWWLTCCPSVGAPFWTRLRKATWSPLYTTRFHGNPQTGTCNTNKLPVCLVSDFLTWSCDPFKVYTERILNSSKSQTLKSEVYLADYGKMNKNGSFRLSRWEGRWNWIVCRRDVFKFSWVSWRLLYSVTNPQSYILSLSVRPRVVVATM